jgi:hypothetical protein
MTSSTEIVPELFYLKYKGILAPWEILAQAKRIGFKCKKYANWKEVHATIESRDVLRKAGDSLIDTQEFDLPLFPEISLVWERVQRWTKDKDNLSLEPDPIPEYEKLSRLVEAGSKTPNVVDIVIEEFGFDPISIALDDRWLTFLSICIFNFFFSNKRYIDLVDAILDLEKSRKDSKKLINSVGALLIEVYLQTGFDVSDKKPAQLIPFFIEELGLDPIPKEIIRIGNYKLKSLPKVWIEKYDGPQSELVKFNYSEGDLYLKVNKSNKIFQSELVLAELLKNDQYWNLIGESVLSHVGQIDEIQDFFNTFAKKLRLI